MRKYIGKYILLLVIFLALGIAAFMFVTSSQNRTEGQRHTLMNRVAGDLSSKGLSDVDAELDALVSSNDWEAEYGRNNVPSDIRFIKAENVSGPYSNLLNGNSVWSLSEDGEIKGFLVFLLKMTMPQ